MLIPFNVLMAQKGSYFTYDRSKIEEIEQVDESTVKLSSLKPDYFELTSDSVKRTRIYSFSSFIYGAILAVGTVALDMFGSSWAIPVGIIGLVLPPVIFFRAPLDKSTKLKLIGMGIAGCAIGFLGSVIVLWGG